LLPEEHKKNNEMKYITIAVILGATLLTAIDSTSAANFYRAESSLKVILAKKPYFVFKVEPTGIKITPGISEIQKKEASQKPAKAVVFQTAPEVEQISLSELRILYQQAASKYGIDWKLIEAVHQVESGKSTSTCKTSYAGATGPMQFLASTFRHYNDLGGNICDLRSSVFAAANLLSKSGASEGKIDDALFSYNHSSAYVARVKRIMESI